MLTLPVDFINRMKKQLGQDAPAFFACYEQQPQRGLRVNSLRLSPEKFKAISPWGLVPLDILPEGFVLSTDTTAIGSHPYHLAGMFYLQEPSAMAPIAKANVQPGMSVLDLCAAPGGKSGGLAARMAGEGLLVANELVPSRAKTLRYNLERLGIANAAVTCTKPDILCEALPGYFDVVLVDAPCSGEGMFRKYPSAAEEWSLAHVIACAQRQNAILESAAKAVKEGGILVYSTCTFSPEENEGVAESFCVAHPNFKQVDMHRLYPHSFPGEGHFVAIFQRTDEVPNKQKNPQSLSFSPCKEAPFREFCAGALEAPLSGETVVLLDGRVLVLKEALPKGLERVRVLTAGVYAGDMMAGRFQPSHALAMAAEAQWQQTISLEREKQSEYLHGQVVPVEGVKGWCRVAVEGYPLGLGKAVDGMLKNHLPKGLRLL